MTAELLASTVKIIRRETAYRDRLIAQRRTEGATLRQIAAEAGLSHAAIAKILRKSADVHVVGG